jgi:hypothetical protein
MKTAKPADPRPSRGLFFPVLLAAILGVLFWKSFLPDYVHFANDGPLGQWQTSWIQLPQALTGMWIDLNDIGNNGGAFGLDVNTFIRWTLGSVGHAKFLAPIALFILGLGAWTFFRQLRLSPLAAALGAIAAALNSTYFAAACWGVAPQQIAIGMVFFAMALIVSNTPETPMLTRWARLALAGLAVGMNVMEAADIGAIFSLFVAAFAMVWALTAEGAPVLTGLVRGIGRVAIIAVFAGFIAAQTVISLVGSQISGIAGTGQDTESKEAHWDWATQWSLPKAETLGLFVPGLFGYRMDTPKDMMPALQEAYQGGVYWGGVGRDPALDRYFDGGRQGAQPSGFMRFTGGGNYLGILVALLAAFAAAQAFRRENSPFSEPQRKLIWFWSAIIVLSLLLSWGRFMPVFYKLFYALPYASTIRNPAKFLIMLSWATIILFAYGVHLLSRRYLEVPAGNANGLSAQLKNWWAKVRGFDRQWTVATSAIFIASVLAWLIYAGQKPSLVKFLQSVGFPDEGMTKDFAKVIASFSIGQAGFFLILFALAIGLCILVLAGVFSGKRAKLGGILLGALLVLDLGRANLPWIIHWDYKQKYEVGSLNPIVDFLRDKTYEHRVALMPQWFIYLPGIPEPYQQSEQFFDQLYNIEWAQHHFPYYNIQSLDKIQMGRMPVDLLAYESTLQPRLMQNREGHVMVAQDSMQLVDRRWELTNTRYILGAAGWLEVLNNAFDPVRQPFRIIKRFSITLKPGVEKFHQRLEELTVVPNDNGDLALFEFTAALPRVKLYANWQVSANDTNTLQTLASTNFDAAKVVLVSSPPPGAPATNDNPGTVEFKSYAPKQIVLNAQAAVPSVLLLNDRYDPHWSVSVDGKPAELLRCNYIMRGVYLTPGQHTVEFNFTLPHRPLYITVTSICVGILLSGFLIVSARRKSAAGQT